MVDVPVKNKDSLGTVCVDCMFSRDGNVVKEAETLKMKMWKRPKPSFKMVSDKATTGKTNFSSTTNQSCWQ
jgi:hypothetical protein